MKKSFWDKKIPTFLGLIILILGVLVTTFLTNSTTLLQTNALSTWQPQNVRITNVTETSFSVSYYTLDKISGLIKYGKNISLDKSAFDERDQEKLTNHLIHSFTVNNLTPLTKYYFTIISGKDTFYNNNKPFEIVTGSSISNFSENSEILKGKILLPNGNPPLEALIYVTLDNSQVLSVLSKNDGSYEIPLKLIRNSDLSSYYNFSQNSVIKMLIFGDLLTSSVVLSKTQADAVPPITLSKNYDFLIKSSPDASASANLQSFPSFESTSSSSLSKKVEILTPKKDQGFTNDQPLFKGTAKPGEDVQIVIHSDQNLEAKTIADKNGNWSYQPSESLTPGTHTITITTRDLSGILKTITQSFVVYASGTQIANAIGSPTPTPRPTPTPTRTLTPTPTILPKSTTTPTPTPTPLVVAYLTPTLSPTTTPTEILTPTPISTYSGKLLPPTGNNSIMTIGIVGIITFLAGGFLFLLSRKTFRL